MVVSPYDWPWVNWDEKLQLHHHLADLFSQLNAIAMGRLRGRPDENMAPRANRTWSMWLAELELR